MYCFNCQNNEKANQIYHQFLHDIYANSPYQLSGCREQWKYRSAEISGSKEQWKYMTGHRNFR